MNKWFYIWFWKYLLAEKSFNYNWFEVIKCRLKGHPCGPIYYTHCCATEPDWHCKNCGDYIG